jgi:5-methylcytosine-specific restriction enzyme A
MPWTTSTRRQRLPADWPHIRRAVLNRDHHTCRINSEHCTHKATEVDHIINNDDHGPANLQATCHPCHRDKTTAHAHNAMRAIHAKARHPHERHPAHR